MELDLRQIARVRRKNFAQPGAMDYLLSPIRRELEERIGAADIGAKDSLIIDFENGNLRLNHPDVQRCSLIESSGTADFGDQSFDCVVVNLQSSWLGFDNLLVEVNRLLRPGGSLYFSAFGPDTLGELQYSWSTVDEMFHVHPFVDMHFLGDALLKAGLVQPIVDTDWMNVDYPDMNTLFEDLKQEGFTNIYSHRRKSLTGKNRLEKFKQELKNVASKEGKTNITFEVIYGFARSPKLSVGSIRVSPPEIK